MTYKQLLTDIHSGLDDVGMAALGRYHYYQHYEFGMLQLNEDDFPPELIEDLVKACCAFCWWEGDVVEDVDALYEYMRNHLSPERWEVYEEFLKSGLGLCFFPEYQPEHPFKGPFWD